MKLRERLQMENSKAQLLDEALDVALIGLGTRREAPLIAIYDYTLLIDAQPLGWEPWMRLLRVASYFRFSGEGVPICLLPKSRPVLRQLLTSQRLLRLDQMDLEIVGWGRQMCASGDTMLIYDWSRVVERQLTSTAFDTDDPEELLKDALSWVSQNLTSPDMGPATPLFLTYHAGEAES